MMSKDDTKRLGQVVKNVNKQVSANTQYASRGNPEVVAAQTIATGMIVAALIKTGDFIYHDKKD